MENTTIQLAPVDIAERKKLDIRAGDTVRVHLKIKEKNKTRIQIFEGRVLAVKHGKESGGTFIVRRVASGVGVEKIFPIYSPSIDKIEIVKRSKVRRAKLYYIREKVAREIRRKMRRMMNVPVVEKTKALDEEKPKEVKETEEVKTDPPAMPAHAEQAGAPAEEKPETEDKEEEAVEKTKEKKEEKFKETNKEEEK